MAEILKGLLRFCNQRRHWQNWEDFLTAFHLRFLPPSRSPDLKREIERQVQRPGESARVLTERLETVMRRYGKMTDEKQLGQLFYNLEENYQRYIHRGYVRTVAKLLALSIRSETHSAQTAVSIPHLTGRGHLIGV
ncbi:hypothetical protein KM043_015684 [Ampulex compressa]|nr:hypothetical protein KM043_015684 [Ampulex compressa]